MSFVNLCLLTHIFSFHLCFAFRTKAEPQIYYSFAKPMDEDAELVEQRKEQVSF